MERRPATWIPAVSLLVFLFLLGVPVFPCPACRGGSTLLIPEPGQDDSNSNFAGWISCLRCYGGPYCTLTDRLGRGRVSTWERLTWRVRETDWHDRDGVRTPSHPWAAAVEVRKRKVRIPVVGRRKDR